ncbi:baculoviral IAP repeat-containing protein 3-like isoform X2 [Leguminivora glycinivorella]|uniref:baculoviral IAP repeat-containing protein 3-like isoform X2 n=1 Tax=Leguminivora glycinivorella TaxID=1035111 RepID=UPI002010BAC8|nr:baculoviral IAP repeat-containing protein 3-like isoform X2 [Leguminivora glycinivorella]
MPILVDSKHRNVSSVAPGTALFKNAPATAKTRPLVDLALAAPCAAYEPGASRASSLSSSPSSPTLPALPLAVDKPDNNHALAADMHREENRLKTFDTWPLSFISPQTLASNGFYYLGRSDEVRCAFCKVEIMRWVEGDDPARDHQKWAPQCPFLRKQPAAGALPAAPVTDGQDECGARAAPTGANVCMPGPVHPRYATEAARLRTFKDWPKSMKQKPEELAEAGFYYTGQSDKTKCFYCDGGLKDWEEDDVPWEQHARWFDRCAYVQLVKGRDYVQKVISEACVVPETKPAPKPEPVAPAISEDEKSEVEDCKVCKICYENERNVAFVPCGHVVACAKCALATDKCPLCRRTFTSAVRLYYS